jgi:hypothetical protein
MLRKMDKEGRFENFLLPFDRKLKEDNRWVKLADDEIYAGGPVEQQGIANSNTSQDWAYPGTNSKQ